MADQTSSLLTKTVRGSDYSPAIALSEDKDIFSNCDATTDELRYLEFQGNGENTSSFPKFEIAKYDDTRIHVLEQKYVHFRLELSYNRHCYKTFVSL